MTIEQAPPDRAATSPELVTRSDPEFLRLAPLTPDVLRALLRGDLTTASDLTGVELTAYFVEPDLRRRGYATKVLAAALRWASQDTRVRVVCATVGPDNAASLATLAGFSFELVGEQWDDEDGLELVHELRLTSRHTD